MVATVLSFMKNNVGDVYIKPESDFGDMGESYLYTVQEKMDGSVSVSVFDGNVRDLLGTRS